MGVFSKHNYWVVKDTPCSVLHPWTTSCYKNALSTGLRSVRGSSKYFFLVYLIPLLLKWNWKHEELVQTFKLFSRSILFGGFAGATSFASVCFFRWLRGRYEAFSLGLFPGMVGGCFIFLEHPSRRDVDTTLFIALVANLYLKLFDDEGTVKLTLPLELFIFATSSTLLHYFMRSIKDSYTELWPFSSPKLAKNLEDRKHCPHKGPCLENVKRIGKKYFSFALALQATKVMAVNYHKLVNNPVKFLRILFSLKTLRLPMFAGLYVSLLKGISCLLVNYRGQDEAWHVLPAGVIASLSYLIQPNMFLSLIAFSNLIQILCREYSKEIGLPGWPWRELTFISLMGLLFHARAAYPRCFPHYMQAIMDTATDGRAKTVYDLVDKHLVVRQ